MPLVLYPRTDMRVRGKGQTGLEMGYKATLCITQSKRIEYDTNRFLFASLYSICGQ